MGDPLSITASIIAVLQLTGTVIGYIKNATGASEDRRLLVLEIRSVAHLIDFLSDLVEQAHEQGDNKWSATLNSLDGTDGPLKQFEVFLKRLQSKLEPVEGIKKFGKAMSWPFQKKDVSDILLALERYKTLFTLARQNDHMLVLLPNC